MRFRLILALVAFVLAGIAWAVAGDVAVFKRSGTTYWRINSVGELIPATTLSYPLGNSTLRVEAIYGNEPLGTVVNASNVTLTSTNIGVVTVTNLSGNHTLTLPTAASAGVGAKITLVEACNKIGGTGNFTINVTSAGNINGVDTFSLTNTSAAAGNVAFAEAISNGSAWFIGVTRR